MFFSKLNKIWDQNGFEILVGLSLAFIIIFGIYNKLKGKKGSWTKKDDFSSFNFQRLGVNNKFVNKRRPPQESKGELECRRILEGIFNKPFNKSRPDFLRNPVTGGEFNLEIDCYNPELRLGLEYSGVQHYKYSPYFHKNKEAFYNQKYRDDMKKRMCKENGVILIEVPYTVKIENISNFIKSELRKNGFNL